MARVDAIADAIIKGKYDIVGLQEVFDKKSRNKLIERLQEVYPYHVGPGKRGLIKLNSGLMVFSKYPILRDDMIRYSRAAVADRMAHKGAQFVEIEVEGRKVQVINTHAQAQSGENFQAIRDSQYEELESQLLSPNEVVGVPQLIVGDMNTSKSDSLSYRNMLQTFDANDGSVAGDLQTSCNDPANDFSGNNEKHRPKLLDFILLRRNKSQMKVKQRKVKFFRKRWSDDNQSLSDHHAVEALIVME